MLEVQQEGIRPTQHAAMTRSAASLSTSLSKWFLLRTKPSQEHRAKHFLSVWGAGVFLPIFLTTRIRNGREYCPWPGEPLFPGYIFGHFPEHFIAKANITLGVLKVVQFGNDVATVPESLIDEIAARVDQCGMLTQKALAFEHGDKVEIKSGIFAGMTGMFDLSRPGSERAMILLNTVAAEYSSGFGQTLRGAAFRVEVDARSLIRA